MFGFNTEQSALDFANSAREKMQGTGWTVRVWSNQGWHFELTRNNLSLYYCPYFKTYSCLLGLTGAGGGFPEWCDRETFSDPNAAVDHQLKIASQFIETCQKALALGAGIAKAENKESPHERSEK